MSDMEAREAMVKIMRAPRMHSNMSGDRERAIADEILSSGLVVTTAEADRRVADMRDQVDRCERVLAMILYQTGPVAISERSLVSTEWNNLTIERSDEPATGAVRFRAVPLSPTESEADLRCIQPDSEQRDKFGFGE